ncbi:MAG: TolC family protein [Magnetococcales bacterium]|nr:TolC family protein [Magnetococcales bacterium]
MNRLFHSTPAGSRTADMKRKHERRRPMLITMLVAAGVAVTALSGTAATKALDAISLSRTEQESNTLIRERAEESLLTFLKGRTWKTLSLEDAALTALTSNISLKQSSIRSRIAALLEKETEAVFDPVLSFSANHSKSETFDRELEVMKWKSATVGCTSTDCDGVGDASPLCVTYGTSSPITYLRYDQFRPAGYYKATVQASEAPVTGPTQSATFAFSLTKSLPWGATFVWNQTHIYKRTYWSLHPSSDNFKVGYYGRPWTASFGASFSMPLPFSQNFGPYSTLDSALQQAQLNRESGDISHRETQNTILKQVEQAYWDLVSATRILEATIDLTIHADSMVARTKRLFDAGRVTAYTQAQVDAEQARMQGEETGAWNNYITASIALARLMGTDVDGLYLPTGYSQDMETPVTYDAASTIARAQKETPSARMGALATKTAEVSYQAARTQDRPDLDLSISLSGSQSNSLFGYQSFGRSTSKMFDPDTVSVTGSLSYVYPILNRSASANREQVRLARDKRILDEQGIANRNRRLATNAHVSLASARNQTEIMNERLRLAQRAHAKASRMLSLERITDYEYIVQGNDLLTARRNAILAKISVKKAESELLAVLGDLAPRYEDRALAAESRLRHDTPEQQHALSGNAPPVPIEDQIAARMREMGAPYRIESWNGDGS